MAEFESRFDGQTRELAEGVDEAALGRIEWVAYVLDEGVALPGVGYRIGLDPVVGLLPVAGDVATALVSLYIVAESARQGVRKRTLARMVINVGLDAASGAVPLLGDVFDAVWKANKRNATLAVRDLTADGEPTDAVEVELEA